MLQEFNIARCSRKCHLGDRELKPGEEFYSVIVQRDGGLVREDTAGENWSGPPQDAIGWWRQKMPLGGPRKLRPAPEGVLLETLSELVESPGNESLAYLLALLLVRRRVLIDAESQGDDTQLETSEAIVGSPQLWRLTLPADGRDWYVPIAPPSSETDAAIQSQLVTLLYTEE